MNFTLNDIEVEIFLGVPEEERNKKQKILVSLSFEAEIEKSSKSDDIADTVDYFEIYSFVKNFPKEAQYCLLERFYRELLTALNENFPKAKNWNLKIKKFPFKDAVVIVEE